MESTGFERHVRACDNATLPGGRLRFRIGDQAVGWVTQAVAAALDGFSDVGRDRDDVVLRRAQALPEFARILAARGMYRWRGEAFDVRSAPGGRVLTQIDRGAIPSFGVQAVGVHINGLVRLPRGIHLWVARRARDKLLDPGKLDHIVAGGVSAGMDARQTVIKEAAEEAAIPADLAARAVLAGQVRYAMERDEGLRRDVLYCYDLELPADFVPRPADGEVESFELWPLERVFATVRDSDEFKFNVNLVLIDMFIRRGLIGGADADALRSGLGGD